MLAAYVVSFYAVLTHDGSRVELVPVFPTKCLSALVDSFLSIGATGRGEKMIPPEEGAVLGDMVEEGVFIKSAEGFQSIMCFPSISFWTLCRRH